MRIVTSLLVSGLLPLTSAFLSSYSSRTPLRSGSPAASTVADGVDVSQPSDAARPYAAPYNEIERRRNLAIIAHPDAGQSCVYESSCLAAEFYYHSSLSKCAPQVTTNVVA